LLALYLKHGLMSVTTVVPPGLTRAEAQQRLKDVGANVVADKEPPRWRRYLAKFWAPIPWMLELVILIQIGLRDYIDAGVIAGLLLFNATLGFFQEGRATAAVTALKKRLPPTALALRDGEWVRLPAADLVSGDAIRLPLGALVPADARILSGSVMVDQSTLTGESIPVDANPGHDVYAGSIVRRGQALAVVIATGARTRFGRAVELVRVARAASTEQAAIFAATRNLAVVNGTIAIAIIIYAHIVALSSADLLRLALTTLLATIPVALPATFTLSAAFAARALARRGVLLTRLSAAHEAAAMDVLCADKTGTLTRNELEVVEVTAMPGFDGEHVLALAALASSDAGQDPIDTAIRAAATRAPGAPNEALLRFVPFDPSTKMAEAFVSEADGSERRIIKGAFTEIAALAGASAKARQQVDALAARGHRVIAVASGQRQSLRLAGLIAISDPPRVDSAAFIAALRDMNVRTLMVTGDSAVTAQTIARKVGIEGAICPPEGFSEDLRADAFGVFARIVPEEKYRLVTALQKHGHVVGMCGDGVNDAPALRQAQIGIAVSTATDVAKAAAGVVLTEPGLAGVVAVIREGRIGFQRLRTYTFNMLVKKFEIVLFLAAGLILTGHPVMTPVLMVLMLVTNDFLAMSLTTDRASPAPTPSAWRMREITLAALFLGLCKLAFSTALLAWGKYRLDLPPGQLQTLAFATLVFGAQAVLYVVRERRRLWSSLPSEWVLLASAADIVIVFVLAVSGTLMAPLPWLVVATVLVAAAAFALILDQVKLLVASAVGVLEPDADAQHMVVITAYPLGK
jgi:H+-transporting ATPase